MKFKTTDIYNWKPLQRGFFLLWSVSMTFQAPAQNADIDLLRNINENRNPANDRGMYFLTQTADPVAIATPIVLIGAGLLTKDAELKKNGFISAVSVFGTYSVGYILKKAVNRPRPYEKYPFIQHYRIENDASFPSGSTAVAFSSATSLAMTFKKWYVIAPAYAWAAGVGYSRMHLGAHYPTDVLAGAVLGTGSVFVTRKLNNWINRPDRKKRGPSGKGL